MNRPDHCCKELECAGGRRNNYFEGKRLTADSFRVEQDYLIGRRHLLNRAIFGWGVVYGFAITSADGGLKIGPGLALDECGRELFEAAERKIAFGDLLLFDQQGARVDWQQFFSAAGYAQDVCFRLSVHYAEQRLGPFKVEDSCRCEHTEWEHVCETVRYSLQLVSCEKCRCQCECELQCACESGSRCRCICEHVTKGQPGDCAPPDEIEDPCGRMLVDLRRGVPIACVTPVRDACDGWAFGEDVDVCGPRRLVKRNDLLFDLIQGCDLTRIEKIGWAPWHRKREPVEFDPFSAAFGPDGSRQRRYVTDFWVEFSRPVREDTLRPDCFAMTVIYRDREGGWWQTQRVPIVGLEFLPGGPPGHVRGARMIVHGAWVNDGLRGDSSIFLDCDTRVEIEIRGDFIVDCNGQTVDANGNGTRGGTFLSTFSVKRRTEDHHQGDYDEEDHGKGAAS